MTKHFPGSQTFTEGSATLPVAHDFIFVPLPYCAAQMLRCLMASLLHGATDVFSLYLGLPVQSFHLSLGSLLLSKGEEKLSTGGMPYFDLLVNY